MERWSGKVAIVTGASSGIGAAIAETLVGNGMQVVAVARREDRLLKMQKELEGKPGNLHPLKADVTNEEEVKSVFKWVKETFGGVDVLVNNAGIVKLSPFTDLNIEEWKKMFQVNVIAFGIFSREALISMKERNIENGHIININSVASHGYVNFPGLGPYGSTKQVTKTLTEGLRRELAAQKSKIKVTSISPGVVLTEIFEEPLQNMVRQIPHLQSKDVADAVLYSLATPPNVQITELIIQATGEEY